MILRPAFLPSVFAFCLSLVLAITSFQKAAAEEENTGFAVGRVQFGRASADKWLKVDLRKTNRPNRSDVDDLAVRPAVSATRVITNYPTSYASASALGVPTQPVYPSASTRVSNFRLLQAASIAVNNAHAHSTGSCWRYVKSALLKSETISSYPKTGYAKQAASELVQNYGFVRTAISNPFSAPIGSVLVYGGAGAGHIEIRTRTGFVSDFVSAKPSSRPLIGVFVKL